MAEKEVRVYPPELHLNTELSRRPETKSFGELYDQYKKGQDVSEVADLRDYIDGDSMSAIQIGRASCRERVSAVV